MPRVRIDSLLAERGVFGSRSRAAASVLAGEVRVGPGGTRALKPGQMVEPDVELRVDERARFVSRAGQKLENALAVFGFDPDGRNCLDVGASTGGFTDCLLQRGAARVVALDVAYGELHWTLRNHDRVSVLERTNVRDLEPAMLPFVPDLVTVDVSFISLAKVLPAIVECMAEECDLLALVKPQFEVGRGRVGKGGVVRSPGLRRESLVGAGTATRSLGLAVRGYAYSGLPGPKGNRESFLWCDRGSGGIEDLEAAASGVEP